MKTSMEQIKGKSGDFELTMDDAKNLIPLADGLYDVMKGCDNFVEMTFKHNDSGEEFVVTLQKKDPIKQTPYEYRKYLERQVVELKKKLEVK